MRLLARSFLLIWFFSLVVAACQPASTSPPAATPEQSPTATGLPLAPSATPTPPSPAPTPTSIPDTATPLPSPTPFVPVCVLVGGEFVPGQIETELLPKPLEFLVYLPPCYEQQAEQSYPVLYLIHGQSYQQDQWQRLGVGTTLDALILSGELPPMLVVMPRDRVWSEPTQDAFGQAVAEVLVPWIDQAYRTLPERSSRAVGGLSRGGAWALHLGLRYSSLFGAVGMHSGFVFHTDSPDLETLLGSLSPQNMPRFYMDVSSSDREEIMLSAVWFEAELTHRGIPHEWHIYTGYHDEVYWGAHVEQYLRWYAQNWDE